jgi:hypothetical protein
LDWTVGSLRHAGLAAVLVFSITSCTQFVICASEYNRKKQMISEAFGKKNIKEAGRDS